MTLATPALLFGAISLLMLAYTNRFFVLAKLIRDMHADQSVDNKDLNVRQIPSLRMRIHLVKVMQAFGVLSFVLCTTSMFCLFVHWDQAGEVLFGISVVILALSLLTSLWEVLISTKALNMVLNDFVDRNR